MEPITVNYKVLDPRAKVPAYATPGQRRPTCAPCWMSP